MLSDPRDGLKNAANRVKSACQEMLGVGAGRPQARYPIDIERVGEANMGRQMTACTGGGWYWPVVEAWFLDS